MSNEDYETKGRYAEAIEQFEHTKKQRDEKVRQIQRAISPIINIMGATYGIGGTFTHLAKEAIELDAQMKEWACKANIEAEMLGKHAIEIRESR